MAQTTPPALANRCRPSLGLAFRWLQGLHRGTANRHHHRRLRDFGWLADDPAAIGQRPRPTDPAGLCGGSPEAPPLTAGIHEPSRLRALGQKAELSAPLQLIQVDGAGVSPNAPVLDARGRAAVPALKATLRSGQSRQSQRRAIMLWAGVDRGAGGSFSVARFIGLPLTGHTTRNACRRLKPRPFMRWRA